MKITDPDIIKTGEKDLIEAVKDDLDLDAVRHILEKRMAASSLTSTGGEIIVHNNQIAFRMDFNVQLSGSLMFDRDGNHIPLPEDSGTQEEEPATDLDMDDLDISETLDEIGPDSESGDNPPELETDPEPETDEPEPDDDNPDISLPDYSLDDAEEVITDEDSHDELQVFDENELDENLDLDASEDAPDLLEDLPQPGGELDPLDLPAPENGQDLDEDEAELIENDDDEDILDDDISDILKESREFWEQKKES